MRVAFINQPFDNVILPVQSAASVAIYSYEIAHRLASYCDVTVYCKSLLHGRVEHHRGVRYRFLPVALDLLMAELLKRFVRFRDARRPLTASSLYYRGYALQVAKELKKQRCDIAHLFTFPQFAPLIHHFNPNIKIVLHMHDNSLPNRDRLITKRRLQGTDLILGCSNDVTRKIRRAFPELSDRCKTVYNGVNVDTPLNGREQNGLGNNGNRRLLFVGRVSPEKGVHILIDAFQKVLEHRSKTKLEIVGPQWIGSTEFLDPLGEDVYLSPLKSFYEKPKRYFLYLREGLRSDTTDQINFAGAVPRSRMNEYYTSCDLLINPSLSEAFGRSLIEAMACGLPVIATCVGGMREIVEDGVTGMLVEPNRPDLLASAIIRLLGDEGLMYSMGKRGQERVARFFSWECIAKRLLGIYEHLLFRP